MFIAVTILFAAFIVATVSAIHNGLEAGASENALKACRETLYEKTVGLRDKTAQYDELSKVLTKERKDNDATDEDLREHVGALKREIENSQQEVKELEEALQLSNAIKSQQSADLDICRSVIKQQDDSLAKARTRSDGLGAELIKERDRMKVLEDELENLNEDLELLRKTFAPAPEKRKTRGRGRIAPTRK